MQQWDDSQPWPTLGFAVIDFIESELVHGPGPVSGAKPVLTNEEQRFILRAYEVHPNALCSDPTCTCAARIGQFRYVWSDYVRLKGARKSELVAWLGHVELAGPCRFGGWDANGEPVAITLADLGGNPDIPFAATSEDQAEDTAWSSFYAIAKGCTYADRLDIGLRRVVDSLSSGNARVVTSSSVARDGGRPTATIIEEPHLWFSNELRNLFKVLDRNLAKLGSNDPHGFKVSTMFRVGQRSVLEDDYEAARNGDQSILWDHRGAVSKLDPKNDEHVLVGVKEAIGDATWLDPARIAANFRRDRTEGVRYWWNQRSIDVTRAVDPDDWAAIVEPREVDDGEPIAIGFDGSLFDDATAMTARSLRDGYSWPLGVWLPDGTDDGLEDLRGAVDAALMEAAQRYRLALVLCDPPYWGEAIAQWRSTYGERVVVPWWTNRDNAMAWATHRWLTGITTKQFRHSGDPTVTIHVTNAHRKPVRVNIDGATAWVPTKDRHKSMNKIDACITDILSNEARYIAIQQGTLAKLDRKRNAKLLTF